MNARVEEKSGEELVEIITENVGRMLRRKMDAVTCIRMAAEKAMESWNSSLIESNFTYFSSKYSSVNGKPLIDPPKIVKKNIDIYR